MRPCPHEWQMGLIWGGPGTSWADMKCTRCLAKKSVTFTRELFLRHLQDQLERTELEIAYSLDGTPPLTAQTVPIRR